MLTVLGSGKDFEGRGTLNEIAFSSVGGVTDTVIVCFTSMNKYEYIIHLIFMHFYSTISNDTQRDQSVLFIIRPQVSPAISQSGKQ